MRKFILSAILLTLPVHTLALAGPTCLAPPPSSKFYRIAGGSAVEMELLYQDGKWSGCLKASNCAWRTSEPAADLRVIADYINTEKCSFHLTEGVWTSDCQPSAALERAFSAASSLVSLGVGCDAPEFVRAHKQPSGQLVLLPLHGKFGCASVYARMSDGAAGMILGPGESCTAQTPALAALAGLLTRGGGWTLIGDANYTRWLAVRQKTDGTGLDVEVTKLDRAYVQSWLDAIKLRLGDKKTSYGKRAAPKVAVGDSGASGHLQRLLGAAAILLRHHLGQTPADAETIKQTRLWLSDVALSKALDYRDTFFRAELAAP